MNGGVPDEGLFDVFLGREKSPEKPRIPSGGGEEQAGWGAVASRRLLCRCGGAYKAVLSSGCRQPGSDTGR